MLNRFSDLFSKGSHPKSVIIYYIMSVIFIVLAFVMGVIDNPPGIIMLLLGIYVMAFPYLRRRRERKKRNGK
ncbi:MAG: hypothetical protein WB996_13640 [Ignavibacteriaceae bacterium]